MNKLKLFTENFLVYGLGGIISKIIPVVMVPVVTRLMPDSAYFGISDLSGTVASFASAFAIMGMYDAMYRMFFEKTDVDYRKTVCSTAMAFTLGTSLIIFCIMLAAKDWIAQFFFGDRQYVNVVYLSAMAALVGATNSIVSAPTRMQNRRKIFLIANTVSPVLSYAVSIPLLLNGHYVTALPLASVISGLTMELVFGMLNHEWFDLRRLDLRLLKQLLVIAVPLLPNFLIYWVFNSCDKVMLTNMDGIEAAGIYSVSSKLGHASQLIYTAFAGGWQFFAFSTMNEADQVESNSRIFEYLGIVSYTATVFVCAWSYPFFKVLFAENYLGGYIVAPYLFLAPLLQMLFQVAGNQFLVVRKTWPNMLVLSAGAVLNVVINYTLIPVLGIEGAAIATLAGYVVSDIVCVAVLCGMGLMVVRRRFFAASLVMLAYMLAWRLLFPDNTAAGTVSAVAASAILVCLYKDDLKRLLYLKKKI